VIARALLAAVLLAVAGAAAADEALWQELRNGRGFVLLMRHATTDPGAGDPPGFRLEECPTQRNLSPAGREEARRLGESLARRGVKVDRVVSSPWCRCQDTARLAFGRVDETSPALGNLFGRGDASERQVREMRAKLRALGDANVAWVTHGSTIQALVGVAPAQAEVVVVRVRPDGVPQVRGRLPPP